MRDIGKIFLLGLVVLGSLCISQASAQKNIYSAINYHIRFIHQKANSENTSGEVRIVRKNNPENRRIRGLLTLAIINSRQGRMEEGLVYALQSRNLSVDSKDTDLQFAVSNFLISYFRKAGLYDHARKYIDINEELNRYYGSDLVELQANQQKALLALENHDYDAASQYSNAMRRLMSPVTPQNFRAVFLFIQGEIHFQSGDLKLAEIYFENSQTQLNSEIFDPNISDLYGLIYQRLGQIALDRGKSDLAHKYLNFARKDAKISFNYSFLRDLYSSLYDYYRRTGNKEKAIYSKSEYLKLNARQEALQESISNQLLRYQNVNNEVFKTPKSGSARLLSASFAIIFLLLLSKTTLNILRDEKEKKLIKCIERNKKEEVYPDFSEYLEYI